MKVYLAATFLEASRLREWRQELEQEEIFVTSRWLNEEVKSGDMILGDDPVANSLKDIEDIDNADYFVMDSFVISKSGGKHVEFGYAYATKKPIIVIGPPENVFHFLPNVTRVLSLEEAIQEIKNARGVAAHSGN